MSDPSRTPTRTHTQGGVLETEGAADTFTSRTREGGGRRRQRRRQHDRTTLPSRGSLTSAWQVAGVDSEVVGRHAPKQRTYTVAPMRCCASPVCCRYCCCSGTCFSSAGVGLSIVEQCTHCVTRACACVRVRAGTSRQQAQLDTGGDGFPFLFCVYSSMPVSAYTNTHTRTQTNTRADKRRYDALPRLHRRSGEGQRAAGGGRAASKETRMHACILDGTREVEWSGGDTRRVRPEAQRVEEKDVVEHR